MNDERATVLFVDDEERILRSLRMQFRGRYDVLTAGSGAEAIEVVRGRLVHAVVSDQRMPGMLGAELLSRVRDISPATMRLLLTGYSDMQAIVASVNEGEIFRFIEKPWQPQRLLEAVEQAVQIARRELAVPAPVVVAAAPEGPGIKLLTIDEDPATYALVRELTGVRHDVQYATTLESALAVLSEQEIAIVIAGLKHRSDDVIGALKTLKRYSPGTLTIAVSPLGDSYGLIELINQGQIYRFLPKPLSRELLRRSLQSAIDHYRRIKVAPALAARHAVEEPAASAAEPPATLSARLLGYWRRIRDNGRIQQSA
ncbi:MAG: response regulator [Rudaea sp.]|nr:response regulator [Rudaea sp.]